VATEVKSRGRGRPDEGARAAVVEAATQLFVERDYADVSTDDIVARAGVSRGALYHHFPGKIDLFKAVYRASETRVVERVAQAALAATDPFDALVAGSRAYLREAETSEELRRIGILQSRAVLGWEGWREVAAELGLALVAASLQAAMDAGLIRRHDLRTLSHLMLGALVEGATLVATAAEPGPVREQSERVIVELLEGLRTP
jgi:AcrR family transcriptional regulator